MAYSALEERHTKNLKPVQYYPEESDVPEKSDYSDSKYYYTPGCLKKFNKILPEVNYMKERKCPIYVHEYGKIRSDSTYNNRSSKSFGKSTTTKSKSSNSQSSKSVLDKLEETYWATWKPSREKHPKNPKRNRSGSKNEGFGDTSDSVVKYFQKSNFKVSSASVNDSNYRYGSRASRSSRLIEVNTQQIQTEDVSALNESQINKQDEVTDNTEDEEKVKVIKPDTTLSENDGSNRTDSNKKNNEENDVVPVKDTHIEEEEILEEVAKSKLLEHKDSFIIHKKKQEEVKEYFQQPKCIKLYKKSAPSYLRGGTYPLKSCLRNDTTPKGHFRLGPPGSPMFLTSNSFNRKYAK